MANKKSEYANEGVVTGQDAASLPSPTGREDHLGMAEAPPLVAGEIKKPIGARPQSQVTGQHDIGSDANETIDGLTATEEDLRHHTEDVPTAASREPMEDIPVFERADLPPKI